MESETEIAQAKLQSGPSTSTTVVLSLKDQQPPRSAHLLVSTNDKLQHLETASTTQGHQALAKLEIVLLFACAGSASTSKLHASRCDDKQKHQNRCQDFCFTINHMTDGSSCYAYMATAALVASEPSWVIIKGTRESLDVAQLLVCLRLQRA